MCGCHDNRGILTFRDTVVHNDMEQLAQYLFHHIRVLEDVLFRDSAKPGHKHIAVAGNRVRIGIVNRAFSQNGLVRSTLPEECPQHVFREVEFSNAHAVSGAHE